MTTYYRVEIDAINEPTPSDGFIDHTKIETYMAAGSVPSTFEKSMEKDRANERFLIVREQLHLIGNMYFSNIEAPDADADTPPTSFSFVIQVERGDESLATEDETSAGTWLTADDAIRRAVARALMVERTNNNDIYDPTETTAPGNNLAYPRRAARILNYMVGKLVDNLTDAEAAVTVTKILDA